MRGKRRNMVQNIPSNWDNEPAQVKTVEVQLEPGDLVVPLRPLSISDNKSQQIDDHRITVPVSINRPEAYDQDGNPTVDGATYGVYVGQKRLLTPIVFDTSPGAWFGKRKMEKLYTMHHICIFNGVRCIVKLEDIKKLQ